MLKNFSREGKKSFVWGKKRRVSGRITGCVIFLFIYLFFPAVLQDLLGLMQSWLIWAVGVPRRGGGLSVRLRRSPVAAAPEHPRRNAAAVAGGQRCRCIDFCGITADFGGLPAEQPPLTRW